MSFTSSLSSLVLLVEARVSIWRIRIELRPFRWAFTSQQVPGHKAFVCGFVGVALTNELSVYTNHTESRIRNAKASVRGTL